MTKREREAHEYLSRLLTHYAPELEHLPDLARVVAATAPSPETSAS